MNSTLRIAVACSLLGSALVTVPAVAADSAAAVPVEERVRELEQALAVRDQVIRNLIQRIERLERTAAAAAVPPPVPTPAPAPAPAATPTVAAPGAPSTAESAPLERDDQLIRAAFERALIERGGLLLPQWQFELEPSTSYSHSSSESLVIDGFTIFPVLIVGDIVSERVRRDTLTSALTARLGLPWEMQVELRAPFVYENESRLGGDGVEKKRSDRGVGDLELALSRQLATSANGGLDVLGALRWKMRTAKDPFGLPEDEIPFGSGFQTLSAAVTAVSVLDPVVFFGSMTYTHSLAARKGEDRLDPGDTIGVQLGTAIALNLDTSINFSVEQSFTGRTRLNGTAVPGTYVNTSSLGIGVSRVFDGGQSFDTSVAIGLSADSPDLSWSFSLPVRF